MEINRCQGTLASGFTTYSRTCSKRVFNGSKVNHMLPYASMQSNHDSEDSFEENATRMSISGVQEKFSLVQLKNKVRLTKEGEQGTHILKPIPNVSKGPFWNNQIITPRTPPAIAPSTSSFFMLHDSSTRFHS